ncbi:RISC-loading complex subunit tarbp2-like [Diabrotica virgifera virgifera]|uniref:RISC-loading complex subunit tarbp2-like isoform X1 n=1 Tax=Diabrotica virgifera virgifera TaxID=50390 RepID=A0A6P7GGT0_DIAVI|nr:RISC-loading complex subunit tarbp2-like [Diabrotica virgifera virgifera]XP_050519184.1 RISC-loading complex subunit tarbp2-like [Diabrotica virgifera virgifera]XP_050519186.1 RISC-loading complex subunit tarbp2-like [Diabrotica virgifera virgifera]
MSNHVKTPAMVLQELAIKKGFQSPHYEITHSVTGTHNNRFDYRVRVAGVEATGTGCSKQISKHDAAYNALKLLEEDGIYDPKEIPMREFKASIIQKQCELDAGAAIPSSVNFVAPLKDICAEKKIQDPVFKELSDVGPPHCREFTYECGIGSVKTVATSTTKKMAKQLAAREMLEKLNDILQDLLLECPREEEEFEQLPSTIRDRMCAESALNQKILHRYNKLFGQVIPNKKGKLKDFSTCFRELLNKFEKTRDDFVEDLCEKTEESLVRILDKMELQHDVIAVQEGIPIIVCLCINTDVSLTTSGVGQTFKEAKEEALETAFMMLDMYIE